MQGVPRCRVSSVQVASEAVNAIPPKEKEDAAAAAYKNVTAQRRVELPGTEVMADGVVNKALAAKGNGRLASIASLSGLGKITSVEVGGAEKKEVITLGGKYELTEKDENIGKGGKTSLPQKVFLLFNMIAAVFSEELDDETRPSSKMYGLINFRGRVNVRLNALYTDCVDIATRLGEMRAAPRRPPRRQR